MNTYVTWRRRGLLRGVAGMIFGGYLPFAFGATNYVDCTMDDYAGHDGSSWDKAFKTIQEGVKAASADDVVLVAPGWYDEGGDTVGAGDNYLTNRVYINKRITVRSRDGRASRDNTFIVGRHATTPQDPEGMGMGVDAIRCVRFSDSSSALGAVVEGFTLVNGATHYYNKSNVAGGYDRSTVGGGADFGSLTTSTTTPSFLVDCVISNCVATRGGGIYFGNAVRCRFTGNYANINSPAVRDGNMYYCILDGNFGSTGCAYLGGANAVNCTIVNFANQIAFRGNNAANGTRGLALNTVILQHAKGSSSLAAPLTNCVVAAGHNYYGNDAAPYVYATNNCLSVDMNSYQFVSTATADLRPLSTGDLPGAGDASLLSYIPEKYRYTDYEGKPVPSSGAITAGAIQTPVTPVGGCILYSTFAHDSQDTPGLRVNGYKMRVDMLYSFATKYPDPYRAECLMPLNPAKLAKRKFFGFSANQNGTSVVYHFPMRGTNASYIMSPPAGSVLTVIPVITEKVLWTDPSVADDAVMDGTEEHPYNTLQGAVDVALASNSYWVVFAKKGRYDKGGAVYGDLTNRVAVTNNKTYVRLYAVDGPDETFIVGAGDDESTHKYKYGPAAVRCVASATGCASVNGFTLTGGRCGLNGGSEATDATCLHGGAIFGGSPGFQVEDCVITNCAASRGAASWTAALHRCRIVDCTSTFLGLIRNGVHPSSCVFVDIDSERTDGWDTVIGQTDRAYNCTFIGHGAASGYGIIPIGNQAAAGMFNSLVYGFDVIASAPNAMLSGSYYDNVRVVGDGVLTTEGLSEAKMAFADAANGDYALYSATIPATGGTMNGMDGDFWAYGVPVDIEGNEFEYGADGSVIAGAYKRTIPSIAVTAAATEDSVAVTVTPSGENFVTASSPSLTFTADNAGTRNFQGFYLNGELVTTEPTYTYSYDAASVGTRLNLVAKYVPYWYVDPAKSDSYSGCDWEHAKKTLAAVMEKAVPGDIVYAAPGVYEEGDMIQHKNSYKNNNTATLRARVVLTNGVRLVSRDGPEATIIKGAESSQNLKGYGLGTDALRCAFLYPDAVLEGFTLSGGRGSGGTDYDENDFGAGATGWYDASGIYPEMRNCIVTNCIAERGGGIAHIKAVNCRFLACRCFNNSSAGIHARLVNCLFDYCKGTTSVVGYWTEMRNCTFGAHNEADIVLGLSAKSGMLQTPAVHNTLFAAGRMSSTAATAIQVAFTNCAFNTYMYSKLPAPILTNDTCVVADASMLQLDDAGRPVIGANLAIDAGDTNYLDLAAYPTDLYGDPRAVNGLMMDIGCCEADWKGRYGADLGPKVTVTNAAPAVCETAQRAVALYDGTEVALTLANPSGRNLRRRISFRVNGEGSLSMSVDGGEPLVFTDTGAVQTYEFRNTATSTAFDFSFAGTGSAELLEGAMTVGSVLSFR